MKILFNNLSLYGNYANYQKPKKQVHNESENIYLTLSCDKINISAVPFCAKPDSTMLLSQSDKLLCAYSRKPMLSPYTLRSIFAKLAKKTNAQSAINFLKEFRDYMPPVETEIFDMFEESGASGKKTFQDILIEKRPESLTNLRQKQSDILHGTDDYILSLPLDNPLAEDLLYIRDVALLKVNDGTFRRSEVLEQLENLCQHYTDADKNCQSNQKMLKQNEQQIKEVYKQWYKLPRSYMDYDAFIVKYSKCSHNDIAQRLLSMSVASVEHIKPYADGGKDILWNYVLIQTLYNQDKGDMNLTEYDELNPDIEIKKNLSKYIDDVCAEIKRGNPYFEANHLYPEQLRNNIVLETGWHSLPAIAVSQLGSRNRQIPNSKKGSNRYRINHK